MWYRVAKAHRMPKVAGHFCEKPLIIGLFCGKWPTKIRYLLSLRYPILLHAVWSEQCCRSFLFVGLHCLEGLLYPILLCTLQGVAVCCSVLQHVLQRVFQCVILPWRFTVCDIAVCVAGRCSVLPCIAVCCSVLQRVLQCVILPWRCTVCEICCTCYYTLYYGVATISRLLNIIGHFCTISSLL